MTKTDIAYLPLPTKRAAELDETAADNLYLIDELWSDQAVGFIAGAPKCCKSWLGLDMAVSVASGTPCLGEFDVPNPGPALVYLAEDSQPQVRARISGICRQRDVDLDTLGLHVMTSSSLRLDTIEHQKSLEATLQEVKPRFLLLDPLIRLHQIDENSAGKISELLGWLRRLNRQHEVAIAIVHHMNKRGAATGGGAGLRGSTDLHAWSDSSLYITRGRDVRVTVEHRSAPTSDPFTLELVGDDLGGAFLELGVPGLDPEVSRDPDLDDRVRTALAAAAEPIAKVDLRAQLKVNNQRLGQALQRLQESNIAIRIKQRWQLVDTDDASDASGSGTETPVTDRSGTGCPGGDRSGTVGEEVSGSPTSSPATAEMEPGAAPTDGYALTASPA